MKLADLNGDGDSKLCICDFDKKLKVYKGRNQNVKYIMMLISYCLSYHFNSYLVYVPVSINYSALSPWTALIRVQFDEFLTCDTYYQRRVTTLDANFR